MRSGAQGFRLVPKGPRWKSSQGRSRVGQTMVIGNVCLAKQPAEQHPAGQVRAKRLRARSGSVFGSDAQ